MCFKYFYNSDPRPKEVILGECQQFGAGLLLLNTPERRAFFQSKGTNEAHVGLSDAKEGTWIWDNGDPADGAVLTSATFDNDDDRYTCPEGADCVVVFIESNSLTFKDYCCDFFKHWYCAIYF
ncbi:CD209 antigen-like protein E [Saccostrea echinata]|uniref:CD209 antigen-like protein E n=1 Tax=Saccostrea echinata TaxID=191078 RepID=UPI002A83D198|nr:CD209 antigen-like protein E [Saccostrea echinata]